MKHLSDLSLIHKKNIVLHYIIPILISILLLLAVLAALASNTADMKRQLRKSTERYAEDISGQLTSNISSRMNMREIYIRNLADTIARMPMKFLTEEFFERKAEFLEMDAIFLVNADGSVVPAGIDEIHPELKEFQTDHPDIYETPHICHSSHEEVLFSAPIFWQDSSETSVLIGVRSNKTLQKMLQEVDYRDQGLSCIVDSDGTVIVSATDEAPFSALQDIFGSGLVAKEDNELQEKIQNDIKEQRPGITHFQSSGKESLVFCYNFLGINDWMLLTLLPSNLFSDGTEPYLIRYFMITAFLALAILLVFFCVIWSYWRSFRTIQTAALTDLLTDGKNRTAFQIEAEHLFQKYSWQNLAIVYMNIRGFKRINEKFGSKTGDMLLHQIHKTLNTCLEEEELICRAAADHFFLLLKCSSEEELLDRTAAMFHQLEKQLPSQFLITSSSIAAGAYLLNRPEKEFTVLIDRAKRAGDQAQTGECRLYDASFEKQLEREYLLDESFQHAIENHEFQLYVQPKVCPFQEKTCGGEVLVRWQHPKFGMIFPGEFIPLFERNGKICALDFYMFEETCRLMRKWLKKGTAVPLSVNLSRAHLISSDMSFLDRFKALKEQYQIPDGLIDLELTESLMLERREMHLVMTMINRIRDMGFLCSIDDFGFGYSSLTMLKDLNVTTVKLDRQFLLNENEKSWMVVCQLIQLAHNLGMSVVAEGVDQPDQVEKLKECGCDLIQGYIYAKPMPVSDFEHQTGI